MEINFNDNKERPNDYVNSFDGNFEDLINKRKKEMPNIQKAINDAFKNYNGGMVGIVIIEEDENGVPSSLSSLVTGVGGIPSSLRLVEGLHGSAEKLKDRIIETSADSGNPRHVIELLAEILKSKKDKE